MREKRTKSKTMLRQNKRFSFLLFWMAAVLSVPALPAGFAGENNQPFSSGILQSASELDYPPFALVLEDGTADGFSVELLKEVAKAVELKVDFTVGPWHEIKQKLIYGSLDVLPLVSYSKERDEKLDFSASYMRLNGTVFVRKGEDSINSERNLQGKEVIVMRGDNAHEYAVQNNITDKLILTDTYEEAMMLLSSGRHDAVLMLQLVGFQLLDKLDITNVASIHSFQDTSLKPNAEPLTGYEQKFCFAVQEGNKKLLSLLNEGLAVVIANGTYNSLYNKWFGPILPRLGVNWIRLVTYLAYILVPLLFVMAVAGLWYLKKEVKRKTKHLQDEIAERQQAEEKFESFFSLVSDIFCIADIDGYFRLINPAAEKILGHTHKELLENPFFEYIHPEDRESTANVIQEKLKQGKTVLNFENRYIAKDGTVKWLEWTSRPMPEQGVTFAVARDCTQRMEMEKQLKKTLADLERSNSELQQFAYVASHDLQEPLRAVVGFLQLIKSRYHGHLDEKGNHYIDRAVKAGHRMQNLINDLLRLSRVNTTELKYEQTDITGIVKEIEEYIKSTLFKDNAEIARERLPKVYADRNQMVSLFQNLIVNGLKYNQSESPTVEIGCRDQGDVYCFRIRDNGIGIPREFQKRIFMIFQRLHTKEEYSGSGIGLALCQKIVERHNGMIWVESEKDGGTTFYFTLPKERMEK